MHSAESSGERVKRSGSCVCFMINSAVHKRENGIKYESRAESRKDKAENHVCEDNASAEINFVDREGEGVYVRTQIDRERKKQTKIKTIFELCVTRFRLCRAVRCTVALRTERKDPAHKKCMLA